MRIISLSKQILNKELDQVVASKVYRSLNNPVTNLISGLYLRKKAGRVFLGLKEHSEEKIEEFFSLIKDQEYLLSLPENSLGRHIYNHGGYETFKEFYTNKEVYFYTGKNKKLLFYINNFMNHVKISHDYWHIMFGYGRSYVDEGCIQAITFSALKSFGPLYICLLICISDMLETKNLVGTKRIYKAYKRAQKTKREFFFRKFNNLLEEDINEIRKRYGIV